MPTSGWAAGTIGRIEGLIPRARGFSRLERRHLFGSPGYWKNALYINSRSEDEVMGTGKPLWKRDDAGALPAVQQLAGKAVEGHVRELVNIAEHQAVARVEQRQRAAVAEIQRIQHVFKAGSVVDRLAESISGLELQPVREAFFGADLQRVVIRIGDGIFGEDAGENGHAIGRAAGAGQRIAVRRRILAQANQRDGVGIGAGNGGLRTVGQVQCESRPEWRPREW